MKKQHLRASRFVFAVVLSALLLGLILYGLGAGSAQARSVAPAPAVLRGRVYLQQSSILTKAVVPTTAVEGGVVTILRGDSRSVHPPVVSPTPTALLPGHSRLRLPIRLRSALPFGWTRARWPAPMESPIAPVSTPLAARWMGVCGRTPWSIRLSGVCTCRFSCAATRHCGPALRPRRSGVGPR